MTKTLISKFFALKYWGALFLIIALLSSCYRFDISKVQYKQGIDLYYYPHKGDTLPLRHVDGKLVDSSGYKDFLVHLSQNNFRYITPAYNEQDIVVKNSDKELIEDYSNVNGYLQVKQPQTALRIIHDLKRKYPDIIKFSDILFFEAKAHEDLGNNDSSNYYYKMFLQYGGNKYSRRFRGYVFADSQNREFEAERKVAINKTRNIEKPTQPVILKTYIPKYYYPSNISGYLINKEDPEMNKKILYGFEFAGDKNNFQYGISLSYLLHEKVYPGIAFLNSKKQRSVTLYCAFQAYKANNNRVGLKIVPCLDLIEYRGGTVNPYVINPGIRFAAGYFINQKLSLGSYYEYHVYNEYHKYQKQGFEFESHNLWECSAYYHLIKQFALKTGINESGYTIGLWIGGVEVGYNFKYKGISLRFDGF